MNAKFTELSCFPNSAAQEKELRTPDLPATPDLDVDNVGRMHEELSLEEIDAILDQHGIMYPLVDSATAPLKQPEKTEESS